MRLSPARPERTLRRPIAITLTATTAALLGSACAARPQPAPAEEHSGVFTLRHEHIATKVGPDRDEPCDIDADLYLPSDATAEHRVPAIVYSHGFGATKTQETDMDAELARRGYVVLAYTQLGHQGSGCQIHLDDPQYEGVVVSQLVDYLGGGAGLAFADAEHTKPLPPLTIVQLDEKDHTGKHADHDPRVGMIGSSYGGEIQFIAAADDPRIDVIVPGLTWNDLNQELAPNYAEGRDGAPPLPGVPKAGMGVSLLRSGEHNPNLDLADLRQGGAGCARVVPAACQIFLDLGTRGALTEQERQLLRSRSVASFVDKINIPVLLTQGQDDRLALSNEAFATYQALHKRGVPVQLLWHRYGHESTWAHDEPVGDSGWDFAPDKVEGAYASMEVIHWFDHYLKDDPVDTGAGFSYYRDWVEGPGVESAKIYGRAGQYPAGMDRSWYLSAGDKLAETPGDEPPARVQAGGSGPARSFTSENLAEAVDVVGSGTLALPVAGAATVFVTLNDVAPDGTVTPVTKIPSPARFAGDGPLAVELVGAAHRFAAGHRVQVTIAGSAPEYWADPSPASATLTVGDYLARLTLPTVTVR